MRTHSISFAMLLCLCGSAAYAASEKSVRCDFSEGIPASFAVYDLDGNEPSRDAKNIGFTAESGWITVADTDGNMVACSTSWYSPSGQSNDWLVTPAVHVDNGAYLVRWRSRAYDAKYADGFKVYLSTTGNEPADFTADAVLTVDAENGDWTQHTISLSDYEGQDVWVAFVNDTYNCSRLYLDDLFVGEEYAAEITVNATRSWPLATYQPAGMVTNVSEEIIDGFSVEWTLNGESYSQDFDIALAPGESCEYQLEVVSDLVRHTTLDYELTLSCNGREQFAVKDFITYVPHCLVAEECTGAWCGYCVEGNVVFDELSEIYPDQFFGIAVHYDDLVECSAYLSPLKSAFHISGYPTAVFNRQRAVHPSMLANYVNEAAVTSTPMFIEISGAIEENIVSLNTEITAIESVDAKVAVAVAVIEDNVVMEGLWQYNAYSGGSTEMGGYELLGLYVPSADLPFQHVARSIDDYNGTDESLISQPVAGESYDYDCKIEVPESVLEVSNIKLIALLLNRDSGEIINAARIAYTDLEGANLNGISSISTDALPTDARIYNLQGLPVTNPTPGHIYIQNGKKIRF